MDGLSGRCVHVLWVFSVLIRCNTRVQQFASLYAKKLGFKESVLQKCLWGEYYFDPKAKRVILPKHLKGRNLKPMFVQFVLENIWAVYGSVVIEP